MLCPTACKASTSNVCSLEFIGASYTSFLVVAFSFSAANGCSFAGAACTTPVIDVRSMTLGLLSEYSTSILTVFVSQISYDTSSIFKSDKIPPAPIEPPGPDCPELGPAPTAPPPAPPDDDTAGAAEDVEEEDELELHVPNPVKCFVQTIKSEPLSILHSFDPDGIPDPLFVVQSEVISVSAPVYVNPICCPALPLNVNFTGLLKVNGVEPNPTSITDVTVLTTPDDEGGDTVVVCFTSGRLIIPFQVVGPLTWVSAGIATLKSNVES